MKTKIGILIVLVGLTLPVMALSAELKLAPSETVTIRTTDRVPEDVVLLQFTLPEEMASATVARAVLRYNIDCPEGGVAIRANAAPAAWAAETVTSGWWAENKTRLNEREVVGFDEVSCEDGVVALDVARWVRGWAKDGSANFGLVLRRAPDTGGSAMPVARGTYAVPELRIIYR